MHLIALLLFLTAWKPEVPILDPGPPGSFDETAVKDPSIVFADGKWRVFYTARGHHEYSLGYVAAKHLKDLRTAPHVQVMTAYAAAPQVFFFAPQQLWYLIYQTTASNYQPVYTTTKTIDDPRSWSTPKPLITKTDSEKWIDFWIICDATQAVLFYTRDQRDVVALTTSLADFPNGFAHPETVYRGVHEAVHVYRDRHEFALLFEVRNPDGSRTYRLAQADKLLGPWANVPHWTVPASHGELLRSGIDQHLKADVQHPRFLIQKLASDMQGRDYAELSWHLVLLQGR